jgi:adenosyl cobinamide kinase/adenosyl cobinamide phosphate guanylyltransferase
MAETHQIHETYILYFNEADRQIIVDALTTYIDSALLASQSIATKIMTDRAMQIADLIDPEGSKPDIEDLE